MAFPSPAVKLLLWCATLLLPATDAMALDQHKEQQGRIRDAMQAS